MAAAPRQRSPGCNRPDRDVPTTVCGYPLPCPHHTVTIDLASRTVTSPLATQPRAIQRAMELGAALADLPRRKRRGHR